MQEVTYEGKPSVKKIVIGSLVGILLLAALIVFGLFRVQEVVISGNNTYTAKQIQQAVMQDGLCQNTLYLMWKYRDGDKVSESLPFLSAVEITMLKPYKVRIKVYEKAEVGYIQSGGKNIYFDADGLVISQTKQTHENVPMFTGVELGKINLYEELPIEDKTTYRAVVNLGQNIYKAGIEADEVRYSEDNTVLVVGKIKARLGNSENINEKISVLPSILQKISGQQGTLHMENYDSLTSTITFRQGVDEEEVQVGEDGQPVTDPEGNPVDGEGEGETESETETETEITYHESDGTFSTDAEGNKIYTDALGNTTTQCETYNYTNEDGSIITDGYGYIDPYTGAYVN